MAVKCPATCPDFIRNVGMKKAAQGHCAAFEMVWKIAANYFAAFLRASALLVSSQVMSLSSILPK